MSVLEILLVVAVIGYVIYGQLRGQVLRGKRLVLLPAILTIIGFTGLTSAGHHLRPADIMWITVGAVGSVLIGLGFGAASSTPLLFTLGLNRLAQAAVVVPRAIAAGVPFAPDKDGRVFLRAR